MKMKKIYLLGIFLLLVMVVISVQIVRGQSGQTCLANVDLVLAIDRSSNMSYTSKCDWWQLKCINSPSCSQGYKWVMNTTYNESKTWCTARNQTAPHQSVWTEYNPSRMDATKSAAKNLVSRFDNDDQSALVSFATTATLDKTLDNNHTLTQTKIDSLVASGATDIGDAIKLANQELTSLRADGQAAKVIILLTDGMANKPNGTGVGENSADVTYALAKANEAAAAGIKIFTIGLGSEVNATMLQQIANSTGGQYYAAPSGADLAGIYEQIGNSICPNLTGSISGCKYNDANNDGNITGDSTIPGWEIKIMDSNAEAFTQTTDETGCYKFTGLRNGNYKVSETLKDGWRRTYPQEEFYQVNVSDNEVKNINFGNYLPGCGNGTKDDNEECDDGNTSNNDGCSAICQIEIPPAVCGNGQLETGEQCDDGNNISGDGCTAKCALEVYNGINCWDLNGNRINDLKEDVNQDGKYDALDCKGEKGEIGSPGAPGTSLHLIDKNGQDLGILISANNESSQFVTYLPTLDAIFSIGQGISSDPLPPSFRVGTPSTWGVYIICKKIVEEILT